MAPEDYARSRAVFWGGAAVLFTDAEGRVLTLDPAYRPGRLLLPGGGVDQAERPSAAAVREVAEELGLSVGVRQPLAADWVSRGNPEFGKVYGFPGETVSGTVASWRRATSPGFACLRTRSPRSTSFRRHRPQTACSRSRGDGCSLPCAPGSTVPDPSCWKTVRPSGSDRHCSDWTSSRIWRSTTGKSAGTRPWSPPPAYP